MRARDDTKLLKRLASLRAAESAAASGHNPSKEVVNDAVDSASMLVGHTAGMPLAYRHFSVGDGISPAELALYASLEKDVPRAKQLAVYSTARTFAAARLRSTQSDILADVALLRRKSKQQQWYDSTPVPPSFFSLHSKFKFDLVVGGQRVSELMDSITPEVIEYLRKHPQGLYALNDRQFQELVAELLRQRGFEVQVQAKTRDGGKDIIAVQYRQPFAKYIIECKRYSPHVPVGIGIVQRLHGVRLEEGGTKGIIATTSWFTSDALKRIRREDLQLEGRDFAGIVEWLNEYQRNLISVPQR